MAHNPVETDQISKNIWVPQIDHPTVPQRICTRVLVNPGEDTHWMRVSSSSRLDGLKEEEKGKA